MVRSMQDIHIRVYVCIHICKTYTYVCMCVYTYHADTHARSHTRILSLTCCQLFTSSLISLSRSLAHAFCRSRSHFCSCGLSLTYARSPSLSHTLSHTRTPARTPACTHHACTPHTRTNARTYARIHAPIHTCMHACMLVHTHGACMLARSNACTRSLTHGCTHRV